MKFNFVGSYLNDLPRVDQELLEQKMAVGATDKLLVSSFSFFKKFCLNKEVRAVPLAIDLLYLDRKCDRLRRG